jgi:hypothetical protein
MNDRAAGRFDGGNADDRLLGLAFRRPTLDRLNAMAS